MQVPPVPPPGMPNILPQDAVAKTTPHAQMMAAPPTIQRAVDPGKKGERGNQTRSNNDRAKGGDKAADDGKTGDGRGSKLNLNV